MQCIVAVDQNWAIGYKGKLLTYLPDDLAFFKEKTMNKVVVMGRKTLLSLPRQKPLKDRRNIVLTTDKTFKCDGGTVCYDMEKLKEALKQYPKDEIFIIGGESVYRQLLDQCDTAYITKIHKTYEADTYFPNLDQMGEWHVTWESDIQHYNQTAYTWYKYEKN